VAQSYSFIRIKKSKALKMLQKSTLFIEFRPYYSTKTEELQLIGKLSNIHPKKELAVDASGDAHTRYVRILEIRTGKD
jgi:hypothetical protein